jgi:hypothetical protein
MPSERNNLIAESSLTLTERAILQAISHYMYRENKAWPSIATLAKRTGATKRTIFRVLKALEAKGILKRISRHDGRTANRYKILFDTLALNTCTDDLVSSPNDTVSSPNDTVSSEGEKDKGDGHGRGLHKTRKTDASFYLPQEDRSGSGIEASRVDETDGRPYLDEAEWDLPPQAAGRCLSANPVASRPGRQAMAYEVINHQGNQDSGKLGNTVSLLEFLRSHNGVLPNGQTINEMK